jgi:hypothetical protein
MGSVRVPSEDRRDSVPANRGLMRVAHVRRYSEIVGVLVKYGFVDVVDALHLRPYLTASRRVLSALGPVDARGDSQVATVRSDTEELTATPM